jgi:hypothetical protein
MDHLLSMEFIFIEKIAFLVSLAIQHKLTRRTYLQDKYFILLSFERSFF